MSSRGRQQLREPGGGDAVWVGSALKELETRSPAAGWQCFRRRRGLPHSEDALPPGRGCSQLPPECQALEGGPSCPLSPLSPEASSGL